MQHSSRTVMTQRTLSLLSTIPQADEVTMRNEYFSHLRLICGCYIAIVRTEGKNSAPCSCDPFSRNERRESMASRAGRSSHSKTFRGAPDVASVPDRKEVHRNTDVE